MASSLHRAAEGLVLAAIALLALQWFPEMPLRGMQLSDLLFAGGVGLLALARPGLRSLPRDVVLAIAVFVGGATVSAVVNDGSWVKLLGHLELGLIALAAALIARDAAAARRLQRALVLAAIVGAVIGIAGVVLFFAGTWAPLLNHSGDLLPGPYPRIRGTSIRANQLASLLAVGGLVLLGDRDLVPRRVPRAMVWTALLGAFAFTFSRSIPAAFVAALALIVARKPSRRGSIAVALASLFLVVGLLVSARYEVLLDPTRPQDIRISSAPGTRWTFWQDALPQVLENPVWGIGPGRTAAGVWDAHLTWLNVWALLGIGPLLALAWLCARSIRRRAWREAPGPAAALLSLLFTSLVMDSEDLRHLWILFGLLAGCGVSSKSGGSPSSATDAR